ncbi:Hypothetical predicted protein [Paramuricea clavata]|uniref:Uncharacterized protein n=1 Tax=Paramuricea clavata TaxID=317549 RepID=A0A6S7H4M7_PARCT|nr:Hypothetical predicted protein [Paramuricea clavata]
MREFAITHRDMTTLVSMDDKHKCKVGEPLYPLAAAERGKQVIVGANQVMAVGDHDFSKCTLTPSVNLVIDIPQTISGSFYRGDFYVGFKDSILKPSSPLRHTTELAEILKLRGTVHPVLLLYTDGGPDHRTTYMSVKLSMIALFRSLDLDMLVALRTAPSNSWANPVERIMSIVNTGLQGIGLMRQKMGDNFEKAIANAKSVKEMREKLATDDLKKELGESLSFPIDLLNSQMNRLSLKEKKFQTFTPASEEEINTLWQKCLEIEKGLQRDHLTMKDVKDFEHLKAFLKHCCIEGHIASRPLRDKRSKDVSSLPFPVPAGDGHYRPFEEVYKTITEENRPSKVTRPKTTRANLPFSPSVQHAQNTDVMVQCTECEKWRLVFAKKKLTKRQKQQLTDLLEDMDYTCGFQFDDILLLHGLQVHIKDHDCEDNIEKLYYACDYEPCCIYCGEYVDDVDEDDEIYPQCGNCTQDPVRKRK